MVFAEEDELIVGLVHPRKGVNRRSGICAQRCPGCDQGEGPSRWRSLDLGTIPTYLEADGPRVSCAEHGVVVAQVPRARDVARNTRNLAVIVAWLATHTSTFAVEELMRAAWRTVDAISSRVLAEEHPVTDPEVAILSAVVTVEVDKAGIDLAPAAIADHPRHPSPERTWRQQLELPHEVAEVGVGSVVVPGRCE